MEKILYDIPLQPHPLFCVTHILSLFKVFICPTLNLVNSQLTPNVTFLKEAFHHSIDQVKIVLLIIYYLLNFSFRACIKSTANYSHSYLFTIFCPGQALSSQGQRPYLLFTAESLGHFIEPDTEYSCIW